jgi:hypothetical protein
MIKFILVIKICSALDGDCIPEQTIGLYDSWYQCAEQGTVETQQLMSLIGEKLINNNKLYVTFNCSVSNPV